MKTGKYFKKIILIIAGSILVDKPADGTKDLIELSKKIRDCRLTIIKNCSHVPQEECPEKFIQSVKGFVSGIKFH